MFQGFVFIFELFLGRHQSFFNQRMNERDDLSLVEQVGDCVDRQFFLCKKGLDDHDLFLVEVGGFEVRVRIQAYHRFTGQFEP